MLFLVEFQKDHSRTLRFSKNRKKPILGACANGVVGYTSLNVTNRSFRLVLQRPSLVRGADHRRHIAFTSQFFVLLLSNRGEESRWNSGKVCREVCTSSRQRVHARLSREVRGIFVRCVSEAKLMFAPAERK